MLRPLCVSYSITYILTYDGNHVVAITCNAVLSPVHLSVCGKSQEHSTPAFVIFGHSQTASDEDDGDAWDIFFAMPSSCAIVDGVDDDDAFSLTAIIVVVVVVVVSGVAVDFIDVVVSSSSVMSRHDAVIINVKMSKPRNGLGILERYA